MDVADHIVKIAGAAHVVIGADLDGITSTDSFIYEIEDNDRAWSRGTVYVTVTDATLQRS